MGAILRSNVAVLGLLGILMASSTARSDRLPETVFRGCGDYQVIARFECDREPPCLMRVNEMTLSEVAVKVSATKKAAAALPRGLVSALVRVSSTKHGAFRAELLPEPVSSAMPTGDERESVRMLREVPCRQCR